MSEIAAKRSPDKKIASDDKKMTLKIFGQFSCGIREFPFFNFRGQKNRAKNLMMTKNLVTKKLVMQVHHQWCTTNW